MTSPKGLKKLAEGVGLLKQAPKAAETKGGLGSLDDLINSPKKVEAEVERHRLLAEEADRQAAMLPDADFKSYDIQARTPEEFKQRLPQYRQEKYIEQVKNQRDPNANVQFPPEKDMPVADKYKRWENHTNELGDLVDSNPELRRWAVAGAYTRKDFFGPDVSDPDGPLTFFRMDIKKDPRTGEVIPIQFDLNAYEFGMHIGSKAAGQQLITVKGQKAMQRRFNNTKKALDDLWDHKALQEAGVDPVELFEEAYAEVRMNMFIRFGETASETPNVKYFDTMVEDFFEELKVAASRYDLPELSNAPTATALKKRISSLMTGNYDRVQHPVLTNVKKGLHVRDLGPGNSAEGIANELLTRGIFPDEQLELIVKSEDIAFQNEQLRKLLKDEGYDHVVYINDAEDDGVISIVLFDEKNYQNVYEPTVGKMGRTGGNEAMLSVMLAPLAALLGLNNAEVQ